MGHEFFCQNMLSCHHGFDGDWCVQMQGQCDDDSFDAIVFEHCIDAAIGRIVDLDALAGFLFVGVLVLLDQAWASWRGPVTVESSIDAVGADVGDRSDLNVLWCAASDEYVSFVSGPDDSDTNGVREFFVAKVHRS